MQHLGLLFTLLLLFTNLWGAALAVGWIWRQRWMAAVAAPWLVVTAFYAVECYHGLGDLRLIGLLGTLVSTALIALTFSSAEPAWLGERRKARLGEWRREFRPSALLEIGLIFGGIFGYALLWRFTYPNIDGSSEKLADFSYICSYYAGTTLPVPDAWLHPFASTQYYSFQHYAAALMGRLFGMPPGSAYNLGFCTLVALGGVTAAAVIWLLATRWWVRLSVLLAFVVGGSGLSGFVHLFDKSPSPWSSMRFIGSAPLNQEPLGPLLKKYVEKYPVLELPGEPYSYSIFLGDYHAPLASYPLLALAVVGMILWHREGRRRYAAIAGATLTWTFLANTWSLPLQALGVGGWLLLNLRSYRRLVPSVAAGAAVVWLLSWVYINAFSSAASGYGTALKLVPADEHTPPLLFVMFLLPTIGLCVFGLLSGVKLGRWLAQLWLVLLVFSEFVFVDDIYSGMYDRFNTSLKWWPYIAAGTLITLGPVVLERASWKWVRILGWVLCIYPCSFLYDLGKNWVGGIRDGEGKLQGQIGKIEGHYFLTKEMFPKLIYARLKSEPKGVVIERPTKDGFTNSACLPLFAGHRLWLGWLGHEQLWRGYRDDLPQRQERLFKFYNGELAEAATWLRAEGIDYVLWYQEADTTELWKKVNAQLAPDFDWVEIFTYDFENGRKAGMWKPRSSR